MRMTKIDFMIFDFDGTLVQSCQDLAAAVNYALRRLGAPILDLNTVKHFIGDGVKKLIERSLGDERKGDLDKAREIFLSYYEDHLLDTTSLYPGVLEILDHFHGIHKVIITNKPENLTLKIAQGLGVDGYFEEIVGMDSRSYVKPDKRLLLPYLDKFSVDKEKTVVIGDGVNDVRLAKNAGVMSCALLNGLTDRNQLFALEPDFSCERISELKDLFR